MIRRNKKMLLGIGCLVIIIGGGYLLYQFLFQEHQAKAAIEAFYEYEQQGRLADSWEMFHPYMKEKFDKVDYIQDRVHVFFHHFGVETFNFSVGSVSRNKDWIFEENAEPLDVFHATVTMTFRGKYGHFEIKQPVFTTKIDGDWTILWDYKK